MDVVLDRLQRDLGRGGEQRTDVDVEAEIGERRGDDLLAAVMAVLAHLGHQDAGPTAVIAFEGLDTFLGAGHGRRVTHFGPVDPADRTHLRHVSAERLLERVADLADGRLRPGRGDRQLQEVAVAGVGGLRQRLQSGLDLSGITFGAEPFELGDLCGPNLGVLDLQHRDVLVAVGSVGVDTHDGLAAAVDASLGAGRRLLDAQLRDAGLDGLGHAALLLDLGDVLHGAVGELTSQALHVVAATPRVDDLRGAGLLLEEQLGVAGDPSTEVGGQRQRLVERVRVQALGVTLRRGHRLDAGADDVVVDVLGREAPARGLAVCPQRLRLRVLRVELADEAGPDRAGRPHLGDLHEEVHADGPEEAEPGCERIDVQTCCLPGPQVLDTVGEGVGELEIGRRPGLLHVVARDRDRVEPRHVPAGELEDVADDPHARRRGIDVGVADHELLEDVVLDGPSQLLAGHPLLLGGHDIERHHRQHRAVHRHRHAHLVEGDAVEELAHVVDRVDGNTGHADVAGDARMVGVVAAVGREVERDRQALLAGGQIAPVERVGLLGGREARVLAHRPRLVRVHRRVRATQVRGDARQRVEVEQVVDAVRGGVQRRQVDAFGRRVGERVQSATRTFRGGCRPGVEITRRSVAAARIGHGVPQRQRGEVGERAHRTTSRRSWAVRSVSSAGPPRVMSESTPASRSASTWSRGEPASHTWRAPAAFNAAAAAAPHSP